MNVEERKEEKRLLRRHILKLRAEIDNRERARHSEEIVERLMKIPEIQSAQRLFTFLSFGDEVCLDRLVSTWAAAGKHVYVPKTYLKEKKMVLYRFEGWDKLVEGVYGIREPDENNCEAWDGESLDVIIMPGVAFTEHGERLGYGGGFYDRFLAGLSNLPPLIAACYEMQVVASLPAEVHDYKVEQIVTERRRIVCS